jgi:hypothetical protein
MNVQPMNMQGGGDDALDDMPIGGGSALGLVLAQAAGAGAGGKGVGRGLHSSTFQLNLSALYGTGGARMG